MPAGIVRPAGALAHFALLDNPDLSAFDSVQQTAVQDWNDILMKCLAARLRCAKRVGISSVDEVCDWAAGRGYRDAVHDLEESVVGAGTAPDRLGDSEIPASRLIALIDPRTTVDKPYFEQSRAIVLGFHDAFLAFGINPDGCGTRLLCHVERKIALGESLPAPTELGAAL